MKDGAGHVRPNQGGRRGRKIQQVFNFRTNQSYGVSATDLDDPGGDLVSANDIGRRRGRPITVELNIIEIPARPDRRQDQTLGRRF